jgi:hypothetical protein
MVTGSSLSILALQIVDLQLRSARSISSEDSCCQSASVVGNEAYGSLSVIGLRYLLIRIILHLSLKRLEVIGLMFLILLEVSDENSTFWGRTKPGMSSFHMHFNMSLAQRTIPAVQGVLIVALVEHWHR